MKRTNGQIIYGRRVMEMTKKAIAVGIVSLFVISGLVGMLLIMPGEVEAPGPTYVSGLILTNTTWTNTNSPYILIGNTLVEENITLLIEPGVEVKFDDDIYIKIKGKLVAQGNEVDNILFTSNNTSPAPGDWDTILFADESIDATFYPNGTYNDGSILQYCMIEYSNGISTISAAPFIDHCIIKNGNSNGISIDTAALENDPAFIKITNSTISNINGNGIFCDMNTIFYIENNTIKNNGQRGIFQTNAVSTLIARYNIIENNGNYGVYSSFADDDLIQHNEISENNGGLLLYGGTYEVCYNMIKENTNVNSIILVDHQYGSSIEVKLHNNTIINNSAPNLIYRKNEFLLLAPILYVNFNNLINNVTYEIYNDHDTDMDAKNNWWGTTNTTEIGERVFDYYDDFNHGKVLFDSILTEPSSGAPEIPSEGGSGLQEGAPWPMFRGNVKHTGLSPYDTSGNPGELKWKFTGNDKVSHTSPAIGSDGTIYIGNDDDNLYAINPDGSKKWNFTTGNDIEASPTIGSDGTIYVGSDDCNFYAINPDGTEKWRFETGSDGLWFSSAVINSEGIIYVGFYKKMYAINPDGTELWNFTTGDDVRSSPALSSDGSIYFGSFDHKLYSLNPNGTEKWNFTTNGRIHSSPAIDSDGTIYIGSRDNNLYAINQNGTLKWNYTSGGFIDSSPSIGLDGTIYVGSMDNSLYGINPNGTLNWNLITGNEVNTSPAISSEGTIYFGSFDRKLYALFSNGTEKWSFDTGGNVRSSPAIGSDGTIYVGSYDFSLYAIEKAPNQPPNTSSAPSGPTSGETNTSYSFSTSTTDPEGDQIKYGWDWNGDGTVDEWSNLVDSGTEDNRTHSWSIAGVYNVKVKTQDEFGEESGWSNAISVTITSPPSNQPPSILATVPNQIKPEDSAPWTLDLTPYEADVEDSGADLHWYLTDIDTSFYSVIGMNSSDDVFTFIPIANVYGNDEVVLWLEDSEGAKTSQILWINITSVNDIPYFDPSPPDLFIDYDSPYSFNYTSYVHDIETPNENLILITSEPTEDFGNGYAEINGLNVSFHYPQSRAGEIILITITLSDGEGSDNESIKISIAEEQPDYDNDGIPDSIDEDDDNDGYTDENDQFPLDPSEWLDTDLDGIGDNADLDDDNDGYNDENDQFPLDPSEWQDTDGDGIGNNADIDDDNDGVIDSEDYYPLDPTRWAAPESDIIISSITLSKYGPNIGEEITIYTEIENTGNDDCDVIVKYYDGDPDDGGTQIGIDQEITILSDSSDSVSQSWVATAGNHTLYVIVEDLATGEEVTAFLPITVGENIQPILVLTTGDINIYRFEPGQERTISVEVTCYRQDVNNVRLVVLDDQNLTIDNTITPSITMTNGQTTKFYLRIKAPQLPDGVEKLEKDILIQAVGDNGIFSNAEELDIVVSVSAISLFDPFFVMGAVATGSLATLGAAAAASRRDENWKYLLLLTFAVPLYTRIHGKKTLDNFVRGQVYGHIQSKPGTHFNDIKKTLKVGNGNLAYHLRKLEKEGFIKSSRDKRYRRFYPVGIEVVEDDGIKLSQTQESILDYIEQHPKANQKEIAKELKESQQTISYNLNVLVREGFLTEEKFKGTKRYEIIEENT
jgi:outer membrane protein assembly factor BamB/DNA-binding MarR family transcriptional regulator